MEHPPMPSGAWWWLRESRRIAEIVEHVQVMEPEEVAVLRDSAERILAALAPKFDKGGVIASGVVQFHAGPPPAPSWGTTVPAAWWRSRNAAL